MILIISISLPQIYSFSFKNYKYFLKYSLLLCFFLFVFFQLSTSNFVLLSSHEGWERHPLGAGFAPRDIAYSATPMQHCRDFSTVVYIGVMPK